MLDLLHAAVETYHAPLEAAEAQVRKVVRIVRERLLFVEQHPVVTCIAADSDGFESDEDLNHRWREQSGGGAGAEAENTLDEDSLFSSSAASWSVLSAVVLIGAVGGIVAGYLVEGRGLSLSSILTGFRSSKSGGILGK